MKNSPLLRYTAAIAGAIILLSNSANPPNGHTAAPFDNTCARSGCHDGSNPNGYAGLVSLSGVPATIAPNTTYSLTVTVAVTGGSPVRSGFQLVAVHSATNANAGDLTAGTGSGTEMAGGREYVEHRNAQNFSGGSAEWTFSWKSPASSTGISFFFTGNIASGATSNGDLILVSSESFSFAGGPALSATATSTPCSCNGGSDGTATANPAGGQTPYVFDWSNGQTTQTATGLLAGLQTVTVTDALGATVTASTTVAQPTAINLSANVSGSVTCSANATATATATGGASGFNYAWSNGASGATVAFIEEGTYDVTATDANGCTKSVQINVPGNTTAPAAVAGPAVELTCAAPVTTLNGAGSSTGAGVSYGWTASNGGNIVSGATTLAPLVNAAGTYTLVVTNGGNGCTNESETTASSSIAPPTASATGGTLGCAQPNVTLNATTNAASATFAWSGPGGFSSNAQSPSVSQSGTYVVVVTNTANGCSATATATVSANNAPPNAAATGGTLTCTTTSTAISGTSSTPGATFAWSGPNGYTSSMAAPTVNTAGAYLLTVTNPANGCTATATATVAANNAAPTASATTGGQILTCALVSLHLSATTNANPANFNWSGPGISMTNQAQQNPGVSVPGNYAVVVTNPANGCTATAQTTVNQDIASPGATATGGTQTCVSPVVTLAGSAQTGSATFAWAGPNGFVSSQQNPVAPEPGNYVLTTTGPNGCTASATAVVSQNLAVPTAVVAPPSGNLNCSTSTLQLNGAASSQGAIFNYSWTTNGGNITAGANTLTPTVNQPGVYNLLVVNTSNGCTATDSETVGQTPPVSASISQTLNLPCFGAANGSATALGGGGAAPLGYLWSNGGTAATVSGLAAGTYTVVVTDAENCTAAATATVSQPAALAATASATAETSNGANDGTAAAAPTGGTAPFGYVWSNGATASALSNLAPGSYGVTVSDGNNCTAAQTVTVNSFNCALSAQISSENVSCAGAGDGSASVSVAGAAQPVAYVWSNGATTNFVQNLSPGDFTVQILDANGCPSTLSVNISEPPALAANAAATPVSANGATDGTAAAQPVGGTPGYIFQWSNGATTAALSSLAPGPYTVTVADANGCTAQQTVNVNAFDCALSAQISAVGALCAGGATGQATVSPTGGTAPYLYIWSNGATTATTQNLAAGPFSVSVTDAAGCAAEQTTVISEPQALVVSLVFVLEIVCPDDQNGNLICVASGGTGPYAYVWSNGQIGESASGLVAGTYTATATDANGCAQTFTRTLAPTDNAAPVFNCPVPQQTVCAGASIALPPNFVADNCALPPGSVVQTGGPAIGSALPVGSHLFVFQAMDAVGNSATCSFTIISVAPPTATADVLPDTDGQGLGAINLNPASGTGNFAFAWSGPNGFAATTEDVSGLFAGNYSVSVSDNASGCATVAEFTVENTVAADEPAARPLALRLWPNPAGAEIRFANPSGENFLAGSLTDARGRLVQNLLPSELENGAVGLQNLPEGIFCLVLTAGDGRRVAALFVKG